MTLQHAVTRRINEICSEHNITLGKLCTLSGSNPSTMCDIVNGVTKNPGIITIKRLCDAIDYTLAQFFDTEYFNSLEQEDI